MNANILTLAVIVTLLAGCQSTEHRPPEAEGEFRPINIEKPAPIIQAPPEPASKPVVVKPSKKVKRHAK
jgi:hypothetical protein